MLFLPCKGDAFLGEVDKWVSNCRVVFDPYAHVPSEAKKSVDVREALAIGPIMDLGYFGVIGDAAIVVALVPEDDNFWDCDEEFLG